MAIAGLAYSQTRFFDEDIANFSFGATGWPRAICLLIALGATCQLVYKLAGRGEEAEEPSSATGAATQDGGHRLAQRAAIFVLPFVYLYVTPLIGFYVATPVFIVALLLLLEVRSPLVIAGVTGIVYILILLIFTRFFYVALPNGRLDGFYEFNNAIIAIARTGL
ncbi:tripartite tricarboxylate transporter TctB family protein [Afifella pfennigii]|uniref:tripartite tricarboxylate transporter TctB family protein n=1 Tax=Afifella pfennigii TaxID=209897 RepID=UPI0004790170|nr:tripartite tricarboxylate transporter TctB family protein [Afifella pfennigii]